MAQTVLSDVVFRDELRDYVSIPTTVQTAFFASGVLAETSEARAMIAAPTNTFTLPFWRNIDSSIESNYSNDVYTDVAVPRAVNTSSMRARTAYLNEGFSAMNLVRNITNQDPLEFVGNQLLTYWREVAQRRLIATAVGLYNDNVAGNGGDMVVNAGGLINAAAIIRARGTMGDSTNRLGVIAMHSAVYTELQILNQIDFTPLADQVLDFGRYQGMRVVVDDGLPVIPATTDPVAPAKYLSIIFAPGAIAYAERQPEGLDGLEYEREPNRGNGGGAETLWTRRDFILHPLGYDFTSTTITGNGTETRPQSASWSDLALATNWARPAGITRKNIPIAFVTSNVAA